MLLARNLLMLPVIILFRFILLICIIAFEYLVEAGKKYEQYLDKHEIYWK